MNEFFSWVYGIDSPIWVALVVTFGIVVGVMVYFLLSIHLFVIGYWGFGVALLALVPAYFVAKTYKERRK